MPHTALTSAFTYSRICTYVANDFCSKRYKKKNATKDNQQSTTIDNNRKKASTLLKREKN